MIEAYGNIWDQLKENDAILITTNGAVRKDGTAIMGRGIALQAQQRDRHIDTVLGNLIIALGNNVHPLRVSKPVWFSFPVKHHWIQKADLALIKRSAKQLVEWANNPDYAYIEHWYLPRPGCGNGRLLWEDVKPVIEHILDDRFTVMTFEPD